MTQLETVSTLPEDFRGENTAAEIITHPSGKFLYATNRGNNSVAVFLVQKDTGRLILIQNISTKGKTPRNAELDPTGKWLLVSNQDSNNAVVFRIDQSTGQLTQNGDPVPVPAPFCERFLSRKQGTLMGFKQLAPPKKLENGSRTLPTSTDCQSQISWTAIHASDTSWSRLLPT